MIEISTSRFETKSLKANEELFGKTKCSDNE